MGTPDLITEYEGLSFDYEVVSTLLGEESNQAVEISHRMANIELPSRIKWVMDNLIRFLANREITNRTLIEDDDFEELPDLYVSGDYIDIISYIFGHDPKDILASRPALGSLVEATLELGMLRFSNTIMLLVGEPTEYQVNMREEHVHRVVVRTYSQGIAKARASLGVSVEDDLGMEFEDDLTDWTEYSVWRRSDNV